MVVGDEVREAAAFVRDGRIEAVGDYDLRLDADRTVDLGDLPLLPGVVDSHVHVNEPGRTEWEGFATATRAALAGGVTTICDMPLNSSPVTTTVDALRAKVAAAAGQCAVDVAFWGGAVPGNLSDMEGLLDAGVVGFKCFLIDSGIPEFPPLVRDGLRAAMKAIAESGAPMIVHAEDPSQVTVAFRCVLRRVRRVAAAGRGAAGDRDRDLGGGLLRGAGAHRAPGRRRSARR